VPIQSDKLDAFMHKVFGEIGAAMSAALVVVGDRLGLYKAMAGAGPMTSAELATKTGTGERHVREWLLNQAAGGFVEYDKDSARFTLPDEQAAALADESSPAFLPGAFQVIAAAFKDEERITAAFRSNGGVAWGEHHHDLFHGTERFFRSGYNAHLVGSWIPALEGVEARLREGAHVADVGCGHGASTLILARAFPRSRFTGFDSHPASIEKARALAHKAGVGELVKFELASATNFPGKGYQFVTCFDCLHDMGDPIGAAKHVRGALAPDGTWMIVEPFAGDKVEDNLNPIGRVYSAASTMICVPASLAERGPALGAQAGEARIRSVATKGGFKRFRRATETPFNLVFEARP
jgi:SAM-dependent methyltransferase